jgi:hypothetical protein
MSVRGSNPQLSFNRLLPTRQTDWIILDVTNALTVIQLTRRVWSGHLHNWEDDVEDKDDSDWVTDSDSVMGDYGESVE